MEWIEGINRALRFIEDELCGPLSPETVAAAAGFSPFYFQRMFAMMTDMTLGDYIRQRRLSMAGQALQAGAKVLDVALRYGYETPESFQKAFRRFHGITPSAAKKSLVQLRYLNPLQIQVRLVGGSIMDYSVEKIGPLSYIAKEEAVETDEAFARVPVLWDDYYAQGLNRVCPGYIGVSSDLDKENCFCYDIGHFCEEGETPPEGFVRKSLPACTWVKFRSVGAIPGAIQALNRRVFTEWLPGNPDYEWSGVNCNIEVYFEGDTAADDYVCELWLPVEEKRRSIHA